MWIRELFAGLLGFASGLAVAEGMFALLIALGVISRFAGKTHTAAYVIHYENAAALGGILGNLFSVYQFRLPIGLPGVIAFGLFSGVFTGTWAMALTEIVDAVPVFQQKDPPEDRYALADLEHGAWKSSRGMDACVFRLWMVVKMGAAGLFVRLGMKFCPLVVPGKTALCISIGKGCLFEEAIFSISGICPFLDLISGIPELLQFHTGLLHGFCHKSELPVFV